MGRFIDANSVADVLEAGDRVVTVVLTPTMLTSAPFNDPDRLGPGLVVIPAAGPDTVLVVTAVAAITSTGTEMSDNAATLLAFVNTAGQRVFLLALKIDFD